jgi:hypothetical protein
MYKYTTLIFNAQTPVIQDTTSITAAYQTESPTTRKAGGLNFAAKGGKKQGHAAPNRCG